MLDLVSIHTALINFLLTVLPLENVGSCVLLGMMCKYMEMMGSAFRMLVFKWTERGKTYTTMM